MKNIIVSIFLLLFLLVPVFANSGTGKLKGECIDPDATLVKGKCECPVGQSMDSNGRCNVIETWAYCTPEGSFCPCGYMYHDLYGCFRITDPSPECVSQCDQDSVLCGKDQTYDPETFDCVGDWE